MVALEAEPGDDRLTDGSGVRVVAEFLSPVDVGDVDLDSAQARAGERLHAVQAQAQDAIAHWHMPSLPSREELAEKAAAMFVKTPSLDAIAARAHDMLVEAIHARLVATPAAAKA